MRHNPGVRALAANPLLLTILALMKRQGVALPERRVELYHKYVETLLNSWNLAPGLDGRGGIRLDLLDTVRVLAPLALWMHRNSPGVGLVKEGEVRAELERIHRERGAADPVAEAAAFLEDVRRHSGLLLDRGARQYGFIHTPSRSTWPGSPWPSWASRRLAPSSTSWLPTWGTTPGTRRAC